MGTRTNIAFVTSRATHLVRMVNLSNTCRHGPTKRPQPIGILLCSLNVDTRGGKNVRACCCVGMWCDRAEKNTVVHDAHRHAAAPSA
jgi:hypothetical protein